MSGDLAVVPYSPAINPNGAFSIEFWAKPSVSGQNSLAVLASQNRNTGRAGYAAYQGLNGSFWEVHLGTGETVMNLSGGPSPVAGRWDHIVATWDGNATAALYVNGELIGTLASGPFRPNLSVPLEIGSRFNGGIPYNGTVDEVALYGHALTLERVKAHFSVAYVPAVVTQEPPAVATATEAGSLTLTAAASGFPNTYQWYLNGEPIDPAAAGAGHYPQGVTSPTLEIAGIAASDAGTYHLVVTNPLGNKTTVSTVVTYAADTTKPTITYVTADSQCDRGEPQHLRSSVLHPGSAGAGLLRRHHRRKRGPTQE